MRKAADFLALPQSHSLRDWDRLNRGARPLFLLVPLYREQQLVKASFERFRDLVRSIDGLQVVFVTTAREVESETEPSTNALLRALLGAEPAEPLPAIRIVHYPGNSGVMAHQLNYAIDSLERDGYEDFLIGVYNVDSDPPPAGIAYAWAGLDTHPQRVFQQHSWYLPAQVRGFTGCVLQHIAWWQTRWSLHFELGRLLRENTSSDESFRLLGRLHYPIGHGLFMAQETWRRVGGFPEDEVCEDAFLGLMFHVLGVPLVPIPYLERALAPERLDIYVKQQAVWFSGPLYAFRYAWKCIRGTPNGKRQRAIAIDVAGRVACFLSAPKLLLHAVYWLAGPPMVFLAWPAFLWIIDAHLALCIWMLLTLLFTYLLNRQACRQLQRIGVDVTCPGSATAALLAYALHSVGPLLTIGRTIAGRNTVARKYKTEKLSTPDP